MKRTFFLPAIGVCLVLVFATRSIFGQTPDDQNQTPEPSPQTQSKRQKHARAFKSADEFALGANFSYYAPQPGFDRQNRDIDVQIADIAAVAHLVSGWEFLADGFALRAHGTNTDTSSAMNPQFKSDALALGAGPEVRWNFLQFRDARVFLETGGGLLFADRPFPQHGSVYDFLLRAGGGVSFRISESYWADAGFNFSHVSNGKGVVADNPTWQGDGVSFGIRRVFEHAPERTRSLSVPILRKADEGAWTTGAEYDSPLPGFNRKDNLQGDLRVLRISRAWHFADGLEFQLGGSVQKTDSATGFGPLLRWNFVEHQRWRLFADGGVDFLQSGSPAYVIPWSGDGYHLLLRCGGGLSFQLHRSYWLESAFRWVHVITGLGSGADAYPAWSGQGLSVALRHTFQ